MTAHDAVDRAQAGLLRQFALGAFLRVRRGREGLSVETMTERAGLSHMTWRRLEDGYAVRPKTYAAVETVFGLPAGSLTRALSDDSALVELAGLLGVDTSAASDSADPDAVWRFLMSFAGTSWLGVLTSGDGVGETAARISEPPPDDHLETVQSLINHLARTLDRTPTEDDALSALIAWMTELAAVRRSP